VLVLGSPGAALRDPAEDDLGVPARIDLRVLSDEPGFAVIGQDGGGAPLGVGGVDSGGGQRLTDDLGAVGAGAR
jgi:hypothetical protein